MMIMNMISRIISSLISNGSKDVCGKVKKHWKILIKTTVLIDYLSSFR
jgi:hypothetical protein